ncbi:protein with SnoaL 3 domain, NTF 2 superfamily [Colwellia sp. MT41]|uniref:nuclear transport factor 2 family protein n=1 Tax=Colwellia sp. MT41 TaxID=58049 RepID=UPI0007176A8D|nr:nuclear transport factor 2 family protein [Colwellia sp. MT41]ALO33858.1 protein with SnoaL 3 domain, NTF 2 superfamily [Colwellia sp. MT41]
MKKYYCLVIALFWGLTCGLLSVNAFAATDEQSIAKVLNNFHQAAANAQAKPYFNLLSQDAVFLGTDASERWSKEQFKTFVVPYFSKGKGWLYTPIERNITVIKAGQVAFFDELLFSDSYGTCRGSGVLIKTTQGWKISQYNLSIPMPNGLAKALVKQIKAFEQPK